MFLLDASNKQILEKFCDFFTPPSEFSSRRRYSRTRAFSAGPFNLRHPF